MLSPSWLSRLSRGLAAPQLPPASISASSSVPVRPHGPEDFGRRLSWNAETSCRLSWRWYSPGAKPMKPYLGATSWGKGSLSTIIYRVLYTSQVVVWDFWTINSMLDCPSSRHHQDFYISSRGFLLTSYWPSIYNCYLEERQPQQYVLNKGGGWKNTQLENILHSQIANHQLSKLGATLKDTSIKTWWYISIQKLLSATQKTGWMNRHETSGETPSFGKSKHMSSFFRYGWYLPVNLFQGLKLKMKLSWILFF